MAQIPVLMESVPRMLVGEIWRMEVPAAHTIPPGITTAESLIKDAIWQIELKGFSAPPVMPPSDESAVTSTVSGLQYERLSEGKGDRPRTGFVCELEWGAWNAESGTYVDGSVIQSANMRLILGQAPHKFLEEIVTKMQLGEELRVEVPERETPPKLMRFDTVWRLKLLSMRALPAFELPPDDELTATASGLKYKVLSTGDPAGATARTGQTVSVHYSGWLLNGTTFDSSHSRDEPLSFVVGQGVIPGWSEGLQLMRPGDRYLFVIPPSLGYGARGTPGGPIPPDATLVFQVELLEIDG
jgi:FKBP-type peptidyl-prolyl cis-trans isomerase